MPEGLENTGSGSDRVESLLPRCLSKEIDGVSEKNLLTLSLFVFLTSPPFGQEVNAFLLNCLCFLPPVSILCATPCNTGHGWERGNMLNNIHLMSHCMYKRGQ